MIQKVADLMDEGEVRMRPAEGHQLNPKRTIVASAVHVVAGIARAANNLYVRQRAISMHGIDS